MLTASEAMVKEIDGVLAEATAREGTPNSANVTLRQLHAAIERYAPPGVYRQQADKMVEVLSRSGSYASALEHLRSILLALRADYAAGRMRSVVELIHADLFADILEQAEHLHAEGYKVPAAVVAGSALEGHLKQLCDKVQVPKLSSRGEPKKASLLNSELRAAGAYALTDDKAITSWLDIRNNAAHGEDTKVNANMVPLMIAGIREFMRRVPA